MKGAHRSTGQHSIRHAVATELAKSLNLRSLMDAMGWRVPAMALRHMHGNEDATRSALEMLGQTKGATPPPASAKQILRTIMDIIMT